MTPLVLPQATLDALCPMHARLDSSGHVLGVGPTLQRVLLGEASCRLHFSDLFEIFRPRHVTGLEDLLSLAGRRLQVRLAGPRRETLRGLAMPDASGGAILDLSFGLGLVEAVRDHALTSSDFAATDLAIDMLYLVEAKSAAMEASRMLNRRLQGAMLEAEERAFTDPLTGLRNRRAVTRTLTDLLRRDAAFALMHLDLDFFKQVNDTLGHGAGDRVLEAVAGLMRELTREGDTVARIGGDEFVIIVAGVTERQRLAELAARLIARLEAPIELQAQGAVRPARVSASIGIALHRPGAAVSPSGAETLLEESDIALYDAKRAGRGRYAFYPPPEPSVGEERCRAPGRRDDAGEGSAR
ncbi:GGDEF domain-containing protein [Alloyangia pacifica]|uniref:Diguanylate cyclase (GGDEF) domain-containing protein n=1 Tax=Alloyangia pacifica TaxID=311180 RepID=A0A1I6W212_9RHOB|nr:GGDEF domain-containing protein [Alloyangia pacifica]SDI38168.1 diguanylate cyclase (GGDEF) domain-containing protein [Alloyangia pacifica]SFT20013.1 diguanylate cyclase (GGDEF) domain-containing protein [Alloyangia pacifica]